MDSHPKRDEDLAEVVDDLEDKVSDESAPSVPKEEPAPTEGAMQEPPD